MQDENLLVLETIEELCTLSSYLDGFEYVAYDVETTGLEKDAEIIGFSVACEGDLGFYVVLSYWDPIEKKLIYYPSQYKDKAIEILNKLKSKKLIMHNAIFDIDKTQMNFNIDLLPSLHTDTMVLTHLMNENERVGLKDVGARIFGEDAKIEQKEMQESITANGGQHTKAVYELYKADRYKIGKYAAKDATLTLNVFNYFIPRLFEEGLDSFFYDEECMPLLKGPTHELNTVGIKMDVEKLTNLKNSLEQETIQLEGEIVDEITPYIESKYPGIGKKDTFNIGSNSQLSWLLFIKLGETFNSLTKGGKELAKELIGQVPYTNPQKRRFIDECIRLDKKPEKYIQADKATLEIFKVKYPWVDKLLRKKKAEKILNTYCIGILEKIRYGILHPDFLQTGTTGTRYSSRNPNCLSMDTQVLTHRGWLNYEQLATEDLIASYRDDQIVFEPYQYKWISDDSNKEIMSMKNTHIDFRMTSNHRCLFKDRKNKKLSVAPAYKWKKDSTILHGAYNKNNKNMFESLDFLRLLVAAQADSEIRTESSKIRFMFKKKRKHERLLSIIKALGIKHTVRIDNRGFYETKLINVKDKILSYLGENKTFPTEFIGMSSIEREVFLEEIWHWDGLSTRKNNYSSSIEANVDLVQALMAINGWRAHKRVYFSKTGKANYQLDVTKKDSSMTQNTKVSKLISKEKVWCIKLNSETFLARRGSDTFITKNCQNIPRDDKRVKECFIAREGKVFVGADYSQLEPRVFASMSQDKTLLDAFANKEDFYSAIAIPLFGKFDCSADKNSSNFLGAKYPEIRQLGKVAALSIAYGTGAFKLSQSMRLPVPMCEQIIDDYYTRLSGVGNMVKSTHKEIITNGKVFNLFGRPRRIPDAKIISKFGNIKSEDLKYEYRTMLNLAVNYKIQGTSGSIVNRAAIAFYNAAKESIPNSNIVLQIHDELVVECDEGRAEEVVALLKKCMEDTVQLPGVKLIAEPKIAKNIGDLK